MCIKDILTSPKQFDGTIRLKAGGEENLKVQLAHKSNPVYKVSL